jgi:hypothetical protein
MEKNGSLWAILGAAVLIAFFGWVFLSGKPVPSGNTGATATTQEAPAPAAPAADKPAEPAPAAPAADKPAEPAAPAADKPAEPAPVAPKPDAPAQ